MKSLSEIKRNIKSVKSTETITKTMKLVASARIKKAQKLILDGRPFAVKLTEMIQDIHSDLTGEENIKNLPLGRFFGKNRASSIIGVAVISSDRGLCGSFNTNLIRESLKWLKQHKEKKIHTFIVGRKALNFLGRLKGFDIEITEQMTGIFPKVTYANARILGERMMQTYRANKLSKLTIIYNEFTSMFTQTVKIKDILPLPGFSSDKTNKEKYNFVFEPDKKKFLIALIPRFIYAFIYRILLESQAAELAARMNAMDSASKNARELIDDLTVKLNRIRQEEITTELAEIVGGMEAIKA